MGIRVWNRDSTQEGHLLIAKRKLAAVLSLLAGFSSISRAEIPSDQAWFIYDDGNRLYAYCSDVGAFGKGVCSGYILGVTDTLMAIQAGSTKPRVFCLPVKPPPNKGALRDLVVHYLESHSDLRHQGAPLLVSNALAAAYPCTSRKTKPTQPPP